MAKKKTKNGIIPILMLAILVLAASTVFLGLKYFALKKNSSQIFFLYVVKSQTGTLKKDENDVWKLTLSPAKSLTYFADRPYRIAGEARMQKFVESWTKLGFAKNPPNAALSLDPKLNKGESQDTIIVTLQNPTYDESSNTVTFTVIQSDNPTAGLQSFKNKIDKSVPEEFVEPALFIDLSDLATQIENAQAFNQFTLQG